MANRKKDVIFDEELNRAAQFLPFDALKGLSEELNKRIERRNRTEKKELSEEDVGTINETLLAVQPNSTAEIKFFYKGYYLTVQGTVTKIVPPMKYLLLGNQRINFDCIYAIRQIDE